MKPGINYKEYYEDSGKSSNIWNWQGQKFEYYREILRYKKIAGILKRKALKVLDLGCGDGFLSCMLAKAGHKVDAMDISDERLIKFKEKAKLLGIKQISGSVFDHNFQESYDAVILSEVIEHLDDYHSVLQKTCSILAAGGSLVISVPYREKLVFCKCPYCLNEFNIFGHIHTFNEKDFEILAKELSCNILKIETFNNKLSAYTAKYGPIKTYTIYKLSDKFFSQINKKMDTHMLVELIKK